MHMSCVCKTAVTGRCHPCTVIDSGRAGSTDTQVSELGTSNSTAQTGILSAAAGAALCLKDSCRTLGRWLSLIRQLLIPCVFPGCRAYLLRLALLAPGLLVLAIAQLFNATGLLLDELLFRRYRQVRLRRPVFILGVPRSGTTHTHHLLSTNPRFTTVTLWEALLAPSISQRQILTRLARLDRRLGGGVAGVLARIERRLQKSLDSVHPTGLYAPEEDFLLLMSSLDCFLLVLAFPECDWLWHLARGDDVRHRQQARRAMRRYRRLLQRHVYFHGEHRQLLSKNASFAGLAQTLADEFRGSVFIVCERDAQIAVRSQLRSLADVRQQFFIDRVCPEFESNLLETLHFYYRNLDVLKQALPAQRCVSLPLWQLSQQPRQAMQSIHEQLSLGSSEALNEVVDALEESQPARPGTREPAQPTVPGGQGPFDRFQPWRHAPERRL